jgi:hypothetical protein
MRLRPGALLSALLGAALLSAPARAQHVEWRTSIGVTGSYSQSVSDSAYPTADTYAGPSIGLSPTFNLIYETPRTESTLTYAFSVTVPFTRQLTFDTTSFTYSNRLAYAGRFALDEITSMTLGAGVTQSPINSFTTTTDPTEAPIQAVPSGALNLLQITGQQGLTRELSEKWSLNENASAAYGYPIDPTMIRARTLSVQTSLGLSRIFTLDTLGFTATNQTNYFSASEDATHQITPASWAIANTLALVWTRPLSEWWSLSLNAGATQVISPAAQDKMTVQPSGSASINYAYGDWAANLLYSHAALPNLATGQINFTDAATLRFSLPLWIDRTGLSTAGSIGYTRSTPIGGDAATDQPTDVIGADLALNYRPVFADVLTTSLRGQLQRQVPEADPSTAFTRYTISLTLTYSYPSANAANVRPRLTPVYSIAPPAPTEFTSGDATPIEPPQPGQPGQPGNAP